MAEGRYGGDDCARSRGAEVPEAVEEEARWKMKKILVTYSSTNSGGNWWLSDKDWGKLEAAGWKVRWIASIQDKDDAYFRHAKEGRFLGALATEASKEFRTVGAAMREFERITKQKVTDEGCNCCGPPHTFTWENDYASGNDCLEHLFPGGKIPKTVRECLEKSKKKGASK